MLLVVLSNIIPCFWSEGGVNVNQFSSEQYGYLQIAQYYYYSMDYTLYTSIGSKEDSKKESFVLVRISGWDSFI